MFELCQLCTLPTLLYNRNYMDMEMLVYYYSNIQIREDCVINSQKVNSFTNT